MRVAYPRLASSDIGVTVRTTTAVPEGRAGLAYPGVPVEAGFDGPLYLCGLRQNEQDRSNVAFQHMGTPEDGPITLRATVFSGDPEISEGHVLEDRTLAPGGFYQYNGILNTARFTNGYVRVERVEGRAPFYAYGVINDQGNSDGSFVFPVGESSLVGTFRHILPVIVETGEFTSELTVTNLSEEAKLIHFRFAADGIGTGDHTASFTLTLEAGEQRIIADIIDTELRRKGVEGVGSTRGGLAGALSVWDLVSDDPGGIVVGARTGAPDGSGGQYGVFYNAVPNHAAFTDSARVDALQQNGENRSNLALVNTVEIDSTDSVFKLDIYDGDTGRLVKTLTRTVPARHWYQINRILGNHAPATTQGYVRIAEDLRQQSLPGLRGRQRRGLSRRAQRRRSLSAGAGIDSCTSLHCLPPPAHLVERPSAHRPGEALCLFLSIQRPLYPGPSLTSPSQTTRRFHPPSSGESSDSSESVSSPSSSDEPPSDFGSSRQSSSPLSHSSCDRCTGPPVTVYGYLLLVRPSCVVTVTYTCPACNERRE